MDDRYITAHQVFSEYLEQTETPEQKVYTDEYLTWLVKKLEAEMAEIESKLSSSKTAVEKLIEATDSPKSKEIENGV